MRKALVVMNRRDWRADRGPRPFPLPRRSVSARTQEYERVARLGVGEARGCYRDQRAVGVDPEQQVGGLRERTIGPLGGDVGASGVPSGQGRVGEGGSEEGFAAGLGAHHAGLAGSYDVVRDRAAGA